MAKEEWENYMHIKSTSDNPEYSSLKGKLWAFRKKSLAWGSSIGSLKKDQPGFKKTIRGKDMAVPETQTSLISASL